MGAWLRRFGLHLAAAVGATVVFVGASVVGASQTRQASLGSEPPAVVRTVRPHVTATAVATPTAQGATDPSSSAATSPRDRVAGGTRSIPPTSAIDAAPAPSRPSLTPPAPANGSQTATQRPAAPAPPPHEPAATIPSLREAAQPAPPRTAPAPRQAPATTSVPVRPTPELPGSTAKNPPQAHSLSGLIGKVESDGLLVRTSSGQEWRVTAGHGTLIKLGGKPAGLDALRPDDRVVVLGIAEGEEHFQATAVTARRGR